MNTELTKYSKFDLMTSESILLKLDPDRFNKFDYKNINVYNEVFDSEYDGGYISKSKYDNCIFNNVLFDGTQGDSSKFINCQFSMCNFKNATFDHSDFSHSKIEMKSSINSCGFTKCNFSHTRFCGSTIVGCNFIETWLEGTQIVNSSFEYCNFENAVFDSVTLKNVDFSKVSIDYVEFKKCILSNVIFQIFSILHSYNGLDLIKENADEIFLKFPDSPNEIGGREFLNSLMELEAYFYYKNDYFALVNINIFLGENNIAFNNIVQGFGYFFKNKNFKEIKYLCKLASNNMFFSKKQLYELYLILSDDRVIETMSYPEYKIYLDEMEEIRRILVDNPYDLPQTKITIETDIDYLDTKNVSNVIESVNKAYSLVSENSPTYLSIRHNSPDIFEFFLSNTDTVLNNTFIILAVIIFGVSNPVIELIKNLSELAKNELEIYLLKLNISEKERADLIGKNSNSLAQTSKTRTELAPKTFRKHIKRIKFSANRASKDSKQKRTFEIEFTEEYKE